jgi:hypothetical protein
MKGGLMNPNPRKWNKLTIIQKNMLVQLYFDHNGDSEDTVSRIVEKIRTSGSFSVTLKDIENWWEEYSVGLDDDAVRRWIGELPEPSGTDNGSGRVLPG